MNNYIIKINEDTYNISNKDKFNQLQIKFFNYVFKKYQSNENNTIKYNILFINGTKKDLLISVTNRHYIIKILEEIKNINI
jgi:thymidylate kinase